MTKEDLVAGKLNPNVGNGRDHIFKVICGAGKHSQGKAVLKPAIAIQSLDIGVVTSGRPRAR